MKLFSGESISQMIKQAVLIILLFLVLQPDGMAQNKKNVKKTRVRMSLDYYNDYDKSRSLVATLFYIEDRVRIPVVNEMVKFYLGDLSEENVIDSINTNENGEAILSLDEDSRFPVDEGRYFRISANYKGSKTYTAAKSDISLKDITMELFLSEINGTKTIAVRAYELGNEDQLVPVKDAEVSFFVPRLFSDQQIGEGDFNDGKCSIEYPHNIAGDTIGNISLIARIINHDDYGNVERQIKDFRWGSTQPIEEDKSLMTIEISIPTRALWHTNAPLWMIITLIILLTGVWSHYVYVVYQLVKLKRMGDSTKILSPEEEI